jgi:ATP-binding cassette subfamily B protein
MPGGGGGLEQLMGLRKQARRARSSVPDSGLTGPVDIPEPEPEEQSKDLRSRIKRLRESVTGTVRGLPKVALLTWQASPILTIAIGVVTLIAGLLPTVTAYAAKLLLDAVVAAIQGHGTKSAIVWLTVFQFGILTLTAISSALTTISQQLLQEKMSLTIRHQVMDHSSKLHLAYFEGSTSYDMLRQAAQEAPTRPLSMMTSALGLIKTSITFSSMIALLISVSPLLALVSLIAPLPAFVSQSKYGARAFWLTFMMSPIKRRMDYLSSLVTTDTYAKETKLFGLGPYLAERFRQLGRVSYQRQVS